MAGNVPVEYECHSMKRLLLKIRDWLTEGNNVQPHIPLHNLNLPHTHGEYGKDTEWYKMNEKIGLQVMIKLKEQYLSFYIFKNSFQHQRYTPSLYILYIHRWNDAIYTVPESLRALDAIWYVASNSNKPEFCGVIGPCFRCILCPTSRNNSTNEN